MNTQHASAPTALGRELHSSAYPRLHGRWLVLVRLVCLTVCVLSAGLFVADIPSFIAKLHLLCTGTAVACYAHGQLTLDDVRRLHELGLSKDFFAIYLIVLSSVFALGYWLVAAFLLWRKPDDRMALLAAVSLGTFPIVFNTPLINALPWPWWFLVPCIRFLGTLCLGLFFYLFPSGHFVPSWMRWVFVAGLIYGVFNTVFPFASFNPFYTFQVLNNLILLGLIISIVVVQIYRYRWVSSPTQRQQTKWVVYGVSLGWGGYLVIFTISLFFPSLFQTGSLGGLIEGSAVYGFMLLVPLTFGLAIVRSRLWDIDVIINRTLVYGILTAVLALVYFGSVVALQSLVGVFTGHLFSAPQAPLVPIASTLGIAALFQPLRRRIQTIIDRQFYRTRYDAAQTLAAFGARLQQREEVDLTLLADDLLAVVQETMQSAYVSLWLCQNRQSQHETQTVLRTRIVPGWQMEASPGVLAPNDSLVTALLSASGAVEVEKLHLDSPALKAMQAAGVRLAVPVISQGELVGLLQLGPRLSSNDYSGDDRWLLHTLAVQAAPAIRVAQLVHEQQLQAREQERLEEELRIARQIQKAFLPKDLPELAGWQVATYYQPARTVGGDFYDFLLFEDGRLGIVIGDVTDKGIPAALLMTTTRTILRSVAQRETSPSTILEQTNDLLCSEMPPNMFVTCSYAILDPASGQLRYANAGHDQPYRRQHDGVDELWVTGMPLGLLPGMTYEERETNVAGGESVLFYSDGLVEAHNPERTMFGFPRLAKLLEEQRDAPALINALLQDLADFTGPAWEQEDDVTLVTLQRSPGYSTDSSCRFV